MESNSSTAASLLGDKMVNPDNSEFQVADWYSQAESKGLKYIGLYYGAHWAPPSRLYTTNLKEKFWDPVKAGDQKDLIDIIFVSDDREINHFKRNIAKMPWCSIPFEAELTKQSLKSKFNVAELPTFAIIDAKTGTLIKQDAR